ncbi:MAG: FG-GAP-like repeat-containing protein [Cyclobacteriaceae bacterium]
MGTIERLDSMEVFWPDGRVTKKQNISTKQEIIVQQSEALEQQSNPVEKNNDPTWFAEVEEKEIGLSYIHQENDFVDFDRDRLLFHMLSREGPAVAVGDVNGDGREDMYLGGAKDQAGELYIRQTNGNFRKKLVDDFEADKISEDVADTLYAAEGDDDLDLYVGSGGNEFSGSSSALADRLYFNNGQGNFQRNPDALAYRFESTGTVKAADFDQDGDQDLFVGMRLRPFLYGVPVSGYLLENDGQGKFQDVTNQVAPALKEIGMITDSKWVDIDQDEDLDLVIVGEWMSIKLLINEQGQLVDKTQVWGLLGSEGWWNCVEVADLDQDGDYDLVAGNHGLNSRFKATAEQPVSLWVNDFDRNGTAEQIITTYNDSNSYPLVLKHDLVMQMPSLKKKYLKYASYQGETIEDIFEPQQREGAIRYDAYVLESSVFYNEEGQFRRESLPTEAQISPVQAIRIQDINSDGYPDLLLGGNFLGAKPEVGQYSASYGVLLMNQRGEWKEIRPSESGLSVIGEIRHWIVSTEGKDELWIAIKNNGPVAVFKKRKNQPL